MVANTDAENKDEVKEEPTGAKTAVATSNFQPKGDATPVYLQGKTRVGPDGEEVKK